MGGSSKQDAGYKYFENFLLFIGNPIEKLLGINFDNRGWLNPLVDESGNALSLGEINKPSLYGENEGGVAGQIHARYGTANPEPVSFYADYLDENNLPPLAYPYQSYLSFEDFYIGNSGYRKEMLLWPKRIHIKNDGSPQWYDAKAEIGITYYPNLQSDFIPLNIGFLGSVSWLDPNGEHAQVWQSGNFPFYDAEQSYASGGGGNGDALAVQPSIYAVQPVLSANNLQVDFINGTELPPCTWTSYPPETDGFSSGAVARQFKFIGYFDWFGGEFEYKAILSGNYSSIIFSLMNLDGSFTTVLSLSGVTSVDFQFLAGSINLVKGSYQVKVDTGDRYELQNTPRPFVYIEARIKAMGSSASDINPIHKIREILTDDTAMNKPESDVNDANFMKAADRIWNEGLGISWAVTEKSCMDAINELCSHIEAGIRTNRQTGLYEMVLFRDDWFEESEIHSLAENKIKTMQIDPINIEDVKNYLNVSYYDRENIKDASFSIANNASIKNMNGFVNAESADFPYFMNQRNAAVVAQWKLKQFTTPCWKGTFTTGYNEARKWNRYDIVKINWSRKGIVNLPVRIMSINLGDGMDNTVSINFVEVVPFSDELMSTVVIDDKIDNRPLPPQPSVFKAFELSYFEAVQAQGQANVNLELSNNPDIGYVAAVAQRPQNNSLNARLYTDAGAGYEASGYVQYCETAELDQAIDRLSSTFVIKNIKNIAEVRVGSQIFINEETMVFQAFDSVTKVLTVKRGALDTVPQVHDANSILYFADDFVAYDATEYMDNEVVNVKVLTTTPSGVLDIDAATAQSVGIQSRGIRPYPPANVKINDEYYPGSEMVADMQVTWVDRNRLQQTGGEILGYFEAGVTIEEGVTYSYQLFDSDTDTLLDSVSNVTSPMSVLKADMALNNRLELFSLRDGYESYQRFIYNFVKSATELWTPDTLAKLLWLDANDAVVGGDGTLTNVVDKSAGAYNFASAASSKLLVQDDTTVNSKCFVRTAQQYASNATAGAQFNAATHCWAFYVIKNTTITTAGGDAFLLQTSANNFNLGRLASSGLHRPRFLVKNSGGTFGLISSTVDYGTNWIMCFVKHDLTTGTYEIYVNGELVNSGTSITGVLASSTTMYLGSTTGSFNLKMPMLMAGKTDISNDLQKLFGWAAHKYGLTANLPEGHPYKTEPPVV